MQITDQATGPHKDFGFKDGSNLGDDYLYDVNGNMTKDLNKDIFNITYNHLNLPVKIDFSQGKPHIKEIRYRYDATGTKLEKSVKDGNTITTQYAGGFIYNNNGGDQKLQFFSHPEGYVEPVGGTPRSVEGFEIGLPGPTYSSYNYVFQYKDHLGNVRLSYSDADLNGAITPDEIIEESNYYPFGLQHKGYNNVVTSTNFGQNYKYNGKELNKELDLEWYDFGARNYDASLGRWMNIDPLAEKYLSLSPYSYTANNPVFFIDPDGMQIINGETARREKLESQNNAQKENLQQKYGGDLNMSRGDFQSDSDFTSYKSSVEKFNKVGVALSESKVTEANIQLAIDDFKETDPTNFNLADNLTYTDGDGNAQNIDVRITEGGASAYGGAFTSTVFNKKQDGSFKSIESITTTMDFSIINPISNVLPHEMGHGYNATKNPTQFMNDTSTLNCQDPTNRNTFQAKTAKDWQARYDILKSFSQNPIRF